MLPKFIYLHILKTAGTSFKLNFLNSVYKGRYVYDSFFKIRLPGVKREWISLIDLDSPDRPEITKNVDVIFGHFKYSKYADLNWPYVTFLREPSQRLISSYSYLRGLYKGDIGIRDFAEIYPNHQTYVTGGDLSKFKFIGVTEKFDQSLHKFCEIFDIPWEIQKTKHQRVSNKIQKVSSSDMDYIINLNQKDYKLYNQALELLGV